MNGFDLHCHTRASDGIWTPRQLIIRARTEGLAGVAITDHDSLEGLPEAQAAGIEQGVDVIAGAEFAVRWDGRDVHVLGLWLEAGQEVCQYLKQRRLERRQRAIEMVRRLERAGLGPLVIEDDAGADRSLGRPHVAAALVRTGKARDLEDAFARYLTPGRVGYVPQVTSGPDELIAFLRRVGAAVIWAHPALSHLPEAEMPWLNRLDALEADHPRQAAGDRRRLRRLARERNLFITGGSDAHGTPGRDWVGAADTPREVVEALRARALAAKGDGDPH